MKNSSKILLAILCVAVAPALLRPKLFAQPQTGDAVTRPASAPIEMAALRAEVEILKAKATDQSHVMNSVAYHFGNLWFAGQKQNWPLAEFYWSETRSHIHWAIRVIPVRKDPQGNEIRLQEIFDPIEKSVFADLHKSIADKSSEHFQETYKQMLDSCYACHVAAGKPFLKLQIPERAPEPLMHFEPQ